MDAPSRDEAIAGCREVARAEIEAFERLGTPLEFGPGDEIVEWAGPAWLIPELHMPLRPAVLAIAVRRMDELASELDAFLDELGAADWDRRTDSEWSIRMVLDHLASGNGEFIRRLEAWPLDPIEAQAAALAELRGRLAELAGRDVAVDHFGINPEGRRVRWTPRKVLRVVSGLQDAWLTHLSGDGPEPTALPDHADAEGDQVPLREADIAVMVQRDERLREAARNDQRVRVLAPWYRYYRDRLAAWPWDERQRWRAMHAAFRARLLALDETEIAVVRLAPTGACITVRHQLGIAITHIREHHTQIRALKGATPV